MIEKEVFLQKVVEQVFPKLQRNTDAENHVKRISHVICVVLWIICFFLFLMLVKTIDKFEDKLRLFFGALLLPIAVSAFIMERYYRKVKKAIRPLVYRLIGGQVLLTKPSFKHLEKLHFLPNWAVRKKDDVQNDSFYMPYEQIPIFIQEVSYVENHGKHDHYYFRGPLVRFALPKDLNFSLMLLDNNALLPKDKRALSLKEKTSFLFNDQQWQQITLESIDFNKEYKVFTNDQIKARVILTPVFMERINKIKEVYFAPVNIYFNKNQLYLAINTQRNMYEFPTNSNPSLKNFEIFYNEIAALNEFIDFFKKENKI